MVVESFPDLNGLKVLFVIGRLEIGGAERQMVILAGHLQTMGARCAVFSFQQGGRLFRDLHRMEIPVYNGGLKEGDHKRYPWKLALSEWKLIRTIQKCRPEIIHAFLPLENFMGALAGRLCRVSLIVTSRRAMGTHQDRYFFLKPLDRLANLLSHLITVNSEAVGDDTVRRDHTDPGKTSLVYNSVDPLPFEAALSQREKARVALGIANSANVVVVVANLIPYKGHRDVIEAAAGVIQQVPEARFLIVGEDRGIQADLEKLVMQLGIEEKVHFLGQREDIPQILAASDLSVLASHEEGFSNVILESMAAGLPVVATDVGGNREAIRQGVTGWLVKLGDPEALTEKIVDLLKDPERAREWGTRGRKRVREKFSVESMVMKYAELYEKGLKSASQRASAG